jgi:UDP-N-acetylglucosamine 2-epimerase (non-hydrolysing)
LDRDCGNLGFIFAFQSLILNKFDITSTIHEDRRRIMVKKLKWILVAGARPNFMKIAPLIKEIKRYNSGARKKITIEPVLVHTGQHYDQGLSCVFFDQLNIPEPHYNLDVGSGGHGEQTGKVMIAFEDVMLKEKPDLVIVVGDVNSTIACALVAAKLCIPVAHVEAGLRSFDRAMPEEINRILTDQISDFLFTPSQDADVNLKKEGISSEKIFFVGNIMVDSLKMILRNSEVSEIFSKLHNGLFKRNKNQPYALMTLHRPSNVDEKITLKRILACLREISKSMPILFPVHPRTRKQIYSFGLENNISWLNENYELVQGRRKHFFYGLPPLGYLDFMTLMKKTKVIFTDSGGIQEETTVMGIPCITLRENTERPITMTNGTNMLVGTDPKKIKKAFYQANSGNCKEAELPALWDGRTAQRIIKLLVAYFGHKKRSSTH